MHLPQAVFDQEGIQVPVAHFEIVKPRAELHFCTRSFDPDVTQHRMPIEPGVGLGRQTGPGVLEPLR